MYRMICSDVTSTPESSLPVTMSSHAFLHKLLLTCRRILRMVLSPKVFIPFVLLIGMFSSILAFGDIRRVFADISTFEPVYLLYFLLLMVVYESIKCIQWLFLLHSLGIRTSKRSQIFAFVGGVVAKGLPAGNYFQNYLLLQSQGVELGTSTVASIYIILTEVLVALTALCLLEIPGWLWLRPLIIVGSLAFLVSALLVFKFGFEGRNPHFLAKHEKLNRVSKELQSFKTGAARLFNFKVLFIQIILGASYLVTAGAALYMVILGLHVSGFTFQQALAIYFFGLAVAVILPLPVDIGALEISGIGAILAFGLSRSVAVSIMLLNRILSTAAALIIGIVALIVLSSEFSVMTRRRTCSESESESVCMVASLIYRKLLPVSDDEHC